jgi:hypothetical protein
VLTAGGPRELVVGQFAGQRLNAGVALAVVRHGRLLCLMRRILAETDESTVSEVTVRRRIPSLRAKSEAIHLAAKKVWIASVASLFAMTSRP